MKMWNDLPQRTNNFLARSAYEFRRSFLNYQLGEVAVIAAYMDESGIHAGAPAVTSSVVWARPSVWKQWTLDWQRLLPPVRIYHAFDCHNRVGEFKGWSRPERDAWVRQLLPLFPKYRLYGRFGGVHLDAFNQAMNREAPIYKETFGEPYFATIHWALRRLCEAAMAGNGRRVAIVHEITDRPGDVMDAFLYVRKRFPMLDMSISFGSKQEFVPLQAADILAYEGFKFLKGGGVGRKAMEALDPTGKRMAGSFYDESSAAILATGVRELMDEVLAKRAQSA
jgi:hypothetical protein